MYPIDSIVDMNTQKLRRCATAPTASNGSSGAFINGESIPESVGARSRGTSIRLSNTEPSQSEGGEGMSSVSNALLSRMTVITNDENVDETRDGSDLLLMWILPV